MVDCIDWRIRHSIVMIEIIFCIKHKHLYYKYICPLIPFTLYLFMHVITIPTIPFEKNTSLKNKIEAILHRSPKIQCHVFTQTDTNYALLNEEQVEHTIQLLEWIEKNTKAKKKERFAIVSSICTVIGIMIAMSFTFTMMYILWIGFYPPTRLFQSIFFVDRLYDFRDFLTGLRNGSILQYLSDMMVKSMEVSIRKALSEMNAPIQLPLLPPPSFFS